MLGLTLGGEDCSRVKLGTSRWMDASQLDGLQVGSFTLRLLAGYLLDVAGMPFEGYYLVVGHFCIDPDAVLASRFEADHERFFAGSVRVPRNGEGVCSRIEMEDHEAPWANVG